MWRAFQRFMHWWGLWLLTLLIASVILLVLCSTLPPGAGFIYPLRRLFFAIRPAAYWGTVFTVTATCAYAIPYFVSRGISPLDPETYQPIVPDMKAFIALLTISIVAYMMMSSQNFELIQLDDLRTADARYLLIMEQDPYFRDHFLLYDCDQNAFVCEEIYRVEGPRYDYANLQMMRRGDQLILSNGETLLYETDIAP